MVDLFFSRQPAARATPQENVPEVSRVTFADVKGCNEAKAELEEVVDFLRCPAKFTRLGGRLPKGILLTGPPGTGACAPEAQHLQVSGDTVSWPEGGALHCGPRQVAPDVPLEPCAQSVACLPALCFRGRPARVGGVLQHSHLRI